jgi:hypothetical protein
LSTIMKPPTHRTSIGDPAMTTKVRVDLAAGVLEAEGSEAFIRELYLDFRERVSAKVHPPAAARGTSHAEPEGNASTGSQGAKRQAAERRSASGSRRDRTPVFVKNLDLAPKGDRPGLKDFLKGYRKLTSSMEWNGLFVYYLARKVEVAPITMDHVYTCYKHVGERVPKVLTQSLWDTARKKGTIDASSLDDIKLTTPGENWVEHDLEKAASE